nr:SGNH/GDSL hydrolase family protein [Bacteriovorax sp. HI3]
MRKTIKSLLIKVSFFCLSLVLSIAVCEVALNYLLKKYQMPYTYTAVKNNPHKNFNEEKMRRHEDIYEMYKSLPSNLEIITVGDSFTNGGNVEWEQSYPFRLFEKLDRRFPVSNMGICEDTTKGTYMRLSHYFQNKKDLSRKTIVVVLVGAADMFYDTGKEFESFYNEYMGGNHISSESISFKIEDRLSLFSKLKTVKMTKFVFDWAQNKIFDDQQTTVKNALAERLQSCFDSTGSVRRECFIKHLSKIKTAFKDGYSKIFFKKLQDTIISVNLRDKDGSEERIVEDLLTAIHVFPRMLAAPSVLYNLASYTTLQSHYSLELDIIPLVKHITTDERDFFHEIEKDHDQINKSSAMLKSIESWSAYGAEARRIQSQYHEKIINLVQKERGEIIFLTYPLDYKNINSAIMKLAQKENVHVVNVASVFNKLIQSGVPQDELIGDWEHCTPKGYDVIASSVLSKIEEISRLHRKNVVSYQE